MNARSSEVGDREEAKERGNVVAARNEPALGRLDPEPNVSKIKASINMRQKRMNNTEWTLRFLFILILNTRLTRKGVEKKIS